MLIGKKISYYRNKQGLTQEELAKGICHTTYISKIENGHIDPPEATLIDLCKKLNITLEQLKEDRNEKEWNLLKDWAEQIRKKNIKGANKFFRINMMTFIDVENPLLLTHYYITSLRYFILIKDEKKATEIYEKIKDSEKYSTKEDDYYFSLGLYEYHYGKFHMSLAYFEQALIKCREDSILKAESYYYIALILSRLRRVSLSNFYLYKALEIYNERVDLERIIDCNLVLGINFNLMKEYDRAEVYFHKVINAVDRHQKGQLSKGKAYHNLGNIYAKQNISELAIEMLEKSIDFKDEVDTKSNTLYLLTREFFKVGDLEKGKEYYKKGIAFVQKEKDANYELKFKVLYAQYVGKSSSYHTLLKKAISHFRNTDPDFASISAELLARYYAKSFQYKKAYKYLQLALDLKRASYEE